MKAISTIALVSLCALGISGCDKTSSNTTTTVKKETRTDSNGNEKTKVETRTEETTVRKPDAPATENTTTTTVEVKKDPMIKIGPLEIKN